MAVKRNPDATRENLLHAAAGEILKHGYHAAGLDTILKRAGVTKGALYHHFSSKKELALAAIDEVYGPQMLERWVSLLDGTEDPLEAVSECLDLMCNCTCGCGSSTADCDCQSEHSEMDDLLECGCPLNNLAQEMSSVDEDFRRKIDGLFGEWRQSLAAALVRGIENGTVTPDIDPADVGWFLLTTIEGAIGLAKNNQSDAPLQASRNGLMRYLNSLRPEPAAAQT